MTRRRRIVASVVVGTSMACVCVMTLLCLVLYASLERSPLSTIDEYSVLDSGGRMVTEINDETVAQVDAEVSRRSYASMSMAMHSQIGRAHV